jgi:AbrB family looped-hinge helix DNA binding protein
MHDFGPHKSTFYGTATVGTKGQIVIPAEARDELGIKEGDKMVVIGLKDRRMLGVCPVDSIETLLSELTAKLQAIRGVVDQTKKEK